MKLELLSVCLKYTNPDLVPRQDADLRWAHAEKTEVFGSNSVTFQQYIKGFFTSSFSLKRFDKGPSYKWKAFCIFKFITHSCTKYTKQRSIYLRLFTRYVEIPTNKQVCLNPLFYLFFFFSDINILYLFSSGRKLIRSNLIFFAHSIPE